ncbi:hypothetical protein MSAN_00836200 [Mycena sanguinolenta]|uniref:Uncharacterized protein n=1 Tax=Mycena sanguinolenta TaxID=230812 RepID=A0A8H6YYQ2_9AGAR|nr:hypothetical protein MSAN_00836200 [Mycena sanguinolenta]
MSLSLSCFFPCLRSALSCPRSSRSNPRKPSECADCRTVHDNLCLVKKTAILSCLENFALARSNAYPARLEFNFSNCFLCLVLELEQPWVYVEWQNKLSRAPPVRWPGSHILLPFFKYSLRELAACVLLRTFPPSE